MIYRRRQIVTLRRRLDEFRDNRSTSPPNALSIEALLEMMRECPVVDPAFFDSAGAKVLNERLRRFTCNHNTSPDTLDALRQFLTYEDHLLEAELQDPEYGEMLAVHAYMASGSMEAQERFEVLAGLKGTFVARPQPNSGERIELEFDCDPERMLIHVTEFYHWPAANDAGGKQRKGSRQSVKSVRMGYGFLGTGRNLLHIFVKGASAAERIHYLEVDAGGGPYDAPMLMRTGGTEAAAWQGSPQESALRTAHIHRFANAEAEKHAQTGRRRGGGVDGSMYGRWPSEHGSLMPEKVSATWQNLWNQKLIEAIRSGATGKAALALASGADPNWPDDEGMTALHHAAALGLRPCIRLLVGCGLCDYTLKDAQGRYASDLAIEWSTDAAVARLLGIKRRRQAFARSSRPRTAWQAMKSYAAFFKGRKGASGPDGS